MATAAQIAANRRNAQRSTGPRTAAGKARVSQNAKQKHGFRSTLTAIPDYDAPLFRPRLLGLRQELRESVVDAQGSFSFPADEGAYILLIVADVKKGIVLVDSRPLRIVGKEIVTVDLAGKHVTLIPRPNQ